MPVAPGTILQNSQLREYAVSMPDSAPAISATYGRRPSLVLHLLASLHLATPQQDQPAARPDALNAPTVKTSAQPQPTPRPARRSGSRRPSPCRRRATASARRRRRPEPARRSRRRPVPPPPSPTGYARHRRRTGTGTPCRRRRRLGVARRRRRRPARLTGFDTCTAPSLQAMKAWRPKYAAVAIYIGGPEMGCGYGNLSKGWVQSTEAMGWSLMPIYVGPQAPCNSFSDEIDPSQAAAEGTRPRPRPSPTRPASASARARRSTTTWRATTRPTPAA